MMRYSLLRITMAKAISDANCTMFYMVHSYESFHIYKHWYLYKIDTSDYPQTPTYPT